MTAQDITTFRLANLRISQTDNDLRRLVRHMGALQAQDYSGALWSLGLRTGMTQQQIIEKIEKAEIIRTWPQRGTLHFVPAEDATWLVGLSAERLLKGATTRRQRLGLDEKTLDRSKKIIKASLKNETLTRPQFMQALEAGGVTTNTGRGYHILWYFSQSGLTYIGPMRGKQQTIGLIGNLPLKQVKLGRQQSLIELAGRYFTSHGPATLQDFMWWSGLTSADAKAGIEANSESLIAQQVDGQEYWSPKTLSKQPTGDRAYLLPGFDEYLLGYKDRSAALDPKHANAIIPGGNGMFSPTIVVRGHVVGTWQRTAKKDKVLITLKPFKKIGPADRNLLQVPAEKYGSFLGLKPEISLAG